MTLAGLYQVSDCDLSGNCHPTVTQLAAVVQVLHKGGDYQLHAYTGSNQILASPALSEVFSQGREGGESWQQKLEN